MLKLCDCCVSWPHLSIPSPRRCWTGWTSSALTRPDDTTVDCILKNVVRCCLHRHEAMPYLLKTSIFHSSTFGAYLQCDTIRSVTTNIHKTHHMCPTVATSRLRISVSLLSTASISLSLLPIVSPRVLSILPGELQRVARP